MTFAYGARIEVYGLQPNYGPSVGGTSVIVHGKNFVPAVDLNAKPTFTCRFGFFPVLASNALGEEVTATTATCRSPPHAVGFVSVEVSAGPGNFTTFGVVFEFQAAHEPEVLFPPTGLASGGTLVTVAGANFIASNQQWGYGHGNTAQPGSGGGIFLGSGSDAMKGKDALSCRFGGVGAYTVGASAVSSAVLRCETPTFSDAAVGRSLSVDTSTNAGEDFTGSQTYFEPLAEALVLSLSPPAGTSGGGTVVNVFGAGFTVDEPVWCKFGTTGPIPAEYRAENIVRCKSPAKATNMAVPLEVSRGNTFDLTRNNVIFSI
uniref:IPT/TIG domain-containing protein n=1 Tax=Micromonas pusilla TaxID=38833 RepID=A0A7R9T9E4_MICPS